MTETGRIAPSGVRYIKLGKGGGWERECLADGIARRVVEDGRGSSRMRCAARRPAALRAVVLAARSDARSLSG